MFSKNLTLKPVNTFYKEPIHETVYVLKTWMKNIESSKRQKKKMRAIRKGYVDKDRENEGNAYSSGNF